VFTSCIRDSGHRRGNVQRTLSFLKRDVSRFPACRTHEPCAGAQGWSTSPRSAVMCDGGRLSYGPIRRGPRGGLKRSTGTR
jgi:hypothetical protein